jgi:CubicO group peptidase (beta-lactamase class C family)
MITDRFQGLVAHAEQLASELQIPGVAIGVLHDGAVETAGLGVTSRPNPLPVTPETLFQIGSISKTFLGTAVMRLVAQGKIDLDAPLRTYLPGLRLRDPDAQARATMRHLLNHTGGWVGDYFADLGPGDDALRRMVEERMPDLAQITPLGATFSYNNAGFYLAGRVIEVVTGRTFEAAMAELVFAPLGLTDCLYDPAEVMLRRFACGHILKKGGPELASPWPIGRAANPAGGISATVGDLLRYAQFHMGDGAGLLPAALLGQMQAPAVSSVSILDHVGITWFSRELGGVRLIQHGGSTNGQMAALWAAPSRGFAVAILTNASTGGQLHQAIARLAIASYLGLDDADPAPVAAPPERLDACVGRYTAALADIEIVRAGDALELRTLPKGGFPNTDSPAPPAPPPAPLALYSDTCAIVTAGPQKGARAEFAIAPDARAAWVRLGGRVRLREGV